MSTGPWVHQRARPYAIGAGVGLVALLAIAAAWRPLLVTDGFLPHGVCYTWRPGLMRLHLISDVLIGLAYLSIPIGLVYFMRKRRDLPFSWMFLLFGVFIVACGATHWMEVWTLWYPHYWLAGVVKAVTAAASVPTAIALTLLIPHALAIPSIHQVRHARDALEKEVVERRAAEAALHEARTALERRVDDRTAELAAANAELQRQQEWLHVTLSSIGDAVIATDRDGRVTFMNPVAETLTGWIRYDAAQASLSQVFHIVNEHTREPADNPVARAIREGIVVGLGNHTVLIARDGTERAIDDSAAPIRDVSGEVIGAVLIFRDITERRGTDAERVRLLAAERQARNDAEAASRLKDEFLATVSHELRSPLNSIMGWLHVLDSGQLGSAESRQAIDKIRRNVKTQARLIDDLLDVSRIITGKLRLDVRRVEPLALVDAAVETMRAAAEAKRIELSVREDAVATVVAADPDRLAQVLWNLLSNAIKFTPEGGRVEVGLQQVGTQLQISVADTGEGIEPAFLPHVFERFRQAESANRRGRQGLGLGLAVVRHIVEMHGGGVEAHSAGKGEGATFIVKLPIPAVIRDSGEQRSASHEVLPGLRLDNVRVLVVDDEVEARDILRSALGLFGANVEAVDSIEVALERLRAWHPHVLVSDLGLAGEDGYALIRKVRQLDAANGGRTPAIALTALTRPDDRMRALAAGFQMHVAKPVEPHELAVIIATVIGRWPAI
jgi:PAS domain S-box-containing protein